MVPILLVMCLVLVAHASGHGHAPTTNITPPSTVSVTFTDNPDLGVMTRTITNTYISPTTSTVTITSYDTQVQEMLITTNIMLPSTVFLTSTETAYPDLSVVTRTQLLTSTIFMVGSSNDTLEETVQQVVTHNCRMTMSEVEVRYITSFATTTSTTTLTDHSTKVSTETMSITQFYTSTDFSLITKIHKVKQVVSVTTSVYERGWSNSSTYHYWNYTATMTVTTTISQVVNLCPVKTATPVLTGVEVEKVGKLDKMKERFLSEGMQLDKKFEHKFGHKFYNYSIRGKGLKTELLGSLKSSPVTTHHHAVMSTHHD
ncbi:uncharacterized protein [Procambarus clarkii]|uniref:uncharacterized protein n=1 Tax=Procambarus clarkii TaxID=6728 RepID=UPI003742FC1E